MIRIEYGIEEIGPSFESMSQICSGCSTTIMCLLAEAKMMPIMMKITVKYQNKATLFCRHPLDDKKKLDTEKQNYLFSKLFQSVLTDFTFTSEDYSHIYK